MNLKNTKVTLIVAATLSSAAAAPAFAEAVIMQQGGGHITVIENGETVYDGYRAGEHVVVTPNDGWSGDPTDQDWTSEFWGDEEFAEESDETGIYE